MLQDKDLEKYTPSQRAKKAKDARDVLIVKQLRKELD